MRINKLYMENFRNYEAQVLEFCDGINVIYGKNGQGKTNIIEALYFFCNGKSLRNAKDKDIILFGKDFSNIKIYFDNKIEKNSAQIILKDEKLILLNEIGIKKLSELVGFLKAVLFTPEDLNLIKEGPGGRRHFLDIFISSLYPVYFKHLVSYYKVLKQKNTLLKTHDADENLMAVWNEKLSEYGSIIFKYRNYMIKTLSPYLFKFQNEISNEKENLKIVYNPSVKENFCDKNFVLDVLNKNIKREKEMGFSLVGPHRDDFSLFINDKNVKQFASQGQQRTCVLSLKLAECEVINDICGEYPVLLLDDITSEIDKYRREFLFKKIKDKQVFITLTEKQKIQNYNICYIKVEKGIAKREEV